MSIVLTFPLTQDFQTSHFGFPQGDTGRDGETLVGICIHTLESTLESYIAYMHSQRAYADIRPGEHGSVHYAIGAGGEIWQFIQDGNTAWGIQELNNPTWALLPDHIGVEPNYLFIQIGIEQYLSVNAPTLMFRALVELVAKLCEDYDIDVDADHIIAHSALDDTFTGCALPTNLIASVQSLLAQGQEGVSYDVSVLANQVAALQTQMDALQADFDDALDTLTTFADHPATIAGASTLGHIKASDSLTVNGTSGVATVSTLAAAYKLVSGAQTIVASIAAVVQFPTVISDALAWGTLGAFQKVTPNVAGLYRLRARIQFAAATWTAGKYIQLDVFKNGTLLETLGYKVIEANLTSKIVELGGECEFVQSTLTDYYDVRIVTDDANGSKTIASGNCFVERVGA